MIGIPIAIGGAIGAIARFAIGGWVETWAAAGFPWATFLINIAGSTLLGFLHHALPRRHAPEALSAALTIGLCGGFTTFSTFDFETYALLAEARYALAALYSAGSVVTCVAGVFAGMAAGQLVPPSHRPA